MTRINPNKPLTREIEFRHLGDQVLVEIHATYLQMRVKRSRIRHEISWKELLEHLMAREEQQEKQIARREMLRESTARKPAKGAHHA